MRISDWSSDVCSSDLLPADQQGGQFLGRALAPEGPVVLRIADDTLFDLTDEVATVAGAVARRHFSGGRVIGPVSAGLPAGWTLLSPIDLQCVKACGVTFALSAIERLIEERGRGRCEGPRVGKECGMTCSTRWWQNN